MLMGSTKKHVDDTQTMIVVGVNRLREEYELGKADQLRDEHWRKQLRICFGLGLSACCLLGSALGIDTAIYASIIFNCMVHVVL